jgi:hypothetical protein
MRQDITLESIVPTAARLTVRKILFLLFAHGGTVFPPDYSRRPEVAPTLGRENFSPDKFCSNPLLYAMPSVAQGLLCVQFAGDCIFLVRVTEDICEEESNITDIFRTCRFDREEDISPEFNGRWLCGIPRSTASDLLGVDSVTGTQPRSTQ